MLDRYQSERTGTDYENQSVTVFIMPNHGSEVLNRRDQRVFFPLEVARYLIDHAKGKKKPSGTQGRLVKTITRNSVH